MATSSGSGSASGSLLRRQLKQMQSDKDIPGISCGLVNDNNIFEWEVMLMISDDCKYYGGTVLFPRSPPSLRSGLFIVPCQTAC
jgi:ubiquitin-conjugating enzyme E2 G1